MTRTENPGLSAFAFIAIAFLLASYFTFAAVQGNFGLFQRAIVQAEAQDLAAQLARVQAEIDHMENLTLRLSDDFLDLDLLDEQARSVLGLLRFDEIVIQ